MNTKDERDDKLKTYGLCGFFTIVFLLVFAWTWDSHLYMMQNYKWVGVPAFLFAGVGAFSWFFIPASFTDYAKEKFRVICMVSFGLAIAFFGGFHAQYLADLAANLIK